MTSITLPSRFNGPPDSGNGGYSCGVLASYIEGPSKVRLHVPPPLDTEMIVTVREDGGVEMYQGDILVGTAKAAKLDMDTPQAPTLEQAREASKGFVCYENHAFPTCFVCGPERPAGDGLHLYPGPTEDWKLLACPWQPTQDLLDDGGDVRPEYVWSALDCPGYFAVVGDTPETMLLGELSAQIHEPVSGNAPLVVFSWPIGEDGRKRYGGVAIATETGKLLARALTTWITLAA